MSLRHKADRGRGPPLKCGGGGEVDFTVASIGCSVGTGGVNRRGDVKTVQKLLNEHILGDPAFRQAVDGLSGMEGQILIEDGISGPRTEGCIRQFQLTVMRKSERWADGRVDPPAGRNTAATWKALNGNVATMSDLAPTYLSDEVMGAVESALGNCGPYVPFRQGDYGAHL